MSAQWFEAICKGNGIKACGHTANDHGEGVCRAGGCLCSKFQGAVVAEHYEALSRECCAFNAEEIEKAERALCAAEACIAEITQIKWVDLLASDVMNEIDAIVDRYEAGRKP